MMAEALERWLREEMELPPSAVPSPAALRRLCSGPTAPIWDYITRHVQNQRNAKKIRGNLRWYRHLQELEAAPAPPGQQGALRAALERLRNELQDLGDAIADAQETAQRLEASLEEAQSRRWAELERGAELRLLGAEPGPAGLRDCHKGALRATHKRPGQSRGELSAILAAGAEPEVLVSIKALCKAREVELQRPHPHRAAHHPGKAQEAPDWSEQAEAVLIGHSPEAVLWALEVLANQSTRALLASPAPSAEAPPTLKSLLQLHLQQRLRFLSATTRGRRAALKSLQEQVVGVARAGPGSAPPPLEGAWLRRRQLALGALGALGAEPRPPAQATPPLWGLAQEMGVAQGSLLSQAAILRQQLRQGSLRLRWGAGPVLGAEPEPPASPPLTEGVAELLPQLRLVREDCEQRIRDWPRLQELVSQWWAQPAQWVLATPPGCAPFSHWLQCWRAATHALQATPTPEEVPPTIGNGEE
ncbi:HAUS augmin-like complex subunit 5 isoform X2 [Zonotrichia leucophrys gambelii]|uniref:HAUS augmin-like complex subunit 5 isoform X2 n=1 Tax=Zonotrichia leucophrys gambelii TaxID=257770 RepID=UPI003140BAFE